MTKDNYSDIDKIIEAKQEKKNLSHCCGAKIIPMTTEEGTSYYICQLCQKPCDTYQPKTTKQPENWEEIEQCGKRVHMLLYGGEREKDPQYTEWRADLEVSINEWINSLLSQQQDRLIGEIEGMKYTDFMGFDNVGIVGAKMRNMILDQVKELIKTN